MSNRRHFNWWGDADAIWLIVAKRYPGSKIGSIENVRFENISAIARGTSKIEAADGGTIRDIELKNIIV